MKNKIYQYIVLIFSVSFLFCFDNKKSNFINQGNGISKVEYRSETLKVESINGFRHIVDKSKPANDLSYFPSQTTFYQVQDGVDINVEYTVNNLNVEQDIYISEEIINSSNGTYYPENNLVVSEEMIFRGLVVKQITFYPYRINLLNNEIEIYNNVDLHIEEFGTDQIRNYSSSKLSKAFEPLYESLILNYEASSRQEDYQKPSVLYICGGSSINNPYLQELFDWRHRSGFVVHTATTTNDGDGLSGSNTSAVKNYIQNLYENSDNPPEIVSLVGDTGGSFGIGHYEESYSWYSGEGDFPYSLLDGNDLLPEIFIGRISVSSDSELSNVINKTIVYEKATYLSQVGNDWYERAALCGDPSSSGNSTIITNEYIENIMEAYGFEDVSGNYGSGNYSSWMEDHLEDGSLYMNYRGYIGVSGFGTGNINSANNGYKNPFAVFITCGTGSYSGTCLSEEFVRAGTVSNPKGAVAAVGTATSGTHTMYNNIVDMGIFDGIFPKNLRSAGGAMANGRLSLLQAYPENSDNCVEIFSYWNNLIGDAALQLWTDAPKQMYANFNEDISFGTNFIDVQVVNVDDIGVANAHVTLLKGDDDEIFKTVETDINGNAVISLDYISSGEVLLTVTKQNFKPIESSFDIVEETVNVNVDHSNIIIVDENNANTSGNNNGILNPGEIVELYIPIMNYGNQAVTDVQATLVSQSSNVNIISGLNQYGSIDQGQSSEGTYFYLLELNSNVIQGQDLELRLLMSNNDLQWESLIDLNMEAGLLIIDHIELIDNVELDPGEESYIRVFLQNKGYIPVTDIQLDLLPSGYLIDILQGETFFSLINPGQVVGSSLINPLQIQLNDNTVNGAVINVNSSVNSVNGYNQNLTFSLNAGHVTQTDPLGPDDRGYYIYDTGDFGYSLAPFYDWIEIENTGTELNMNDGGNGNNISNSSRVVDLPFLFTFYGETYDQVTINTNGWISFGESSLESFRNYPIPGAGGPSPMLAAFWDDLTTSNNAAIYHRYDQDEDRFIIQWTDMRTYQNNSIETFQVILYDLTTLTPTGDNEIKIQYKVFNNVSSNGWLTHGSYSTIGIENHLATTGLQYSFNNQYPTAAMPLSNQEALFITTRTPIVTLMGDANQDGEVNVLDIVLVVNDVTNLQELDAFGEFVSDLNEDGIINILDIIQIINIILQNN